MSPADARALLQVGPQPTLAELKQAFRAQARRRHPDHGGDADAFRQLQNALRVLRDHGGPAEQDNRSPSRGRPSRSRTRRTMTTDAIDVAAVTGAQLAPGTRLTTEAVAAATIDMLEAITDTPARPVWPLIAVSKTPGARLNRVAAHLSPDSVSRLRISPNKDDRRQVVVATTVHARTRGARKSLDHVALGDRWVRRRGSSVTELHGAVPIGTTHQVTARQVAAQLATLLCDLSWDLPQWTVVRPN
ncbi:MAG: J domain-containing protein [Nitriliruptoraceae bacterium]